MQKQPGTVVSAGGSWGFIRPNDPHQRDIFYHRTSLLDGRARLIADEVVEYELSERNGKPMAVNVRVLVPVVIVNVPTSKGGVQ